MLISPLNLSVLQVQIFIKSSKFTKQSKAHLSLIISRISFSEELKELSCGLSHLSSQRSSKGVWGRHYPQRRCNCPPNSHCLAGGPRKGGSAQTKAIYFPVNKDSVLGAVLWEVFFKAQNMLFLFVCFGAILCHYCTDRESEKQVS